MSMNWVAALWDTKDDLDNYGSNEELITYKPKPFLGAKVCFFGFPEEEERHMYRVLKQLGGGPAKMHDPNCTHVVVDDTNVNSIPVLALIRAHIVNAKWFWTSVKNEDAADENYYLFEHCLESVLPLIEIMKRDRQIPIPWRKHKLLAETSSTLMQIGADSKSARTNLSPHYRGFLELVETESNYVGILSTIMTLFKSPFEDLIGTSGELLNSTQAKIIFGHIPPIYEVHKRILEELRYSASHRAEDVRIGNIFSKYAPDLVKAYLPYVNSFENMVDMLDQCDQKKSKFHAFLEICQTKPECGRLSLRDLLIKPVQRLPGIKLLLNGILKKTTKNNPDNSALELSISSIHVVLTCISEAMQIIEGRFLSYSCA